MKTNFTLNHKIVEWHEHSLTAKETSKKSNGAKFFEHFKVLPDEGIFHENGGAKRAINKTLASLKDWQELCILVYYILVYYILVYYKELCIYVFWRVNKKSSGIVFFFFCTQAFAYLHDMRRQGEIYSFRKD